MSFDVGPFCSEDAVDNRVAHGAVAPWMMMAQDAVFFRAKRFDGTLRLEVEVIGAQSNHAATNRIECVRKQQQLACGVDAGSLPAIGIPGVTDLDAVRGGNDVVITRAPRNGVRGELAYRPREHMASAQPFMRGV